MLQERQFWPTFCRKVLQSGVLPSQVELVVRRQKLAKVKLKPLHRPSKQARGRVWLRVVSVFLGVVAMLVVPYTGVARDIGRSLVRGGYTDAPKTSEVPFPQPKSTSGFLLDRRSADK